MNMLDIKTIFLVLNFFECVSMTAGKKTRTGKTIGIGFTEEQFARARAIVWPKPPPGILQNPKYFQGDIDIGNMTPKKYLASLRKSNGGTKTSRRGNSKAVQQGDTSWKWPNGIVPYTNEAEHSSIEESQQFDDAVSAAIAEVQDNTCIIFRPKKDTDESWVVFENTKDGCFSPVGRRIGPVAINIGEGCENKGIVVHEILHAIGFLHEHSRSDRDEYVEINWWNIKEGKEHNFKIISRDYLDELGVMYDYGSILHYPVDAFSSPEGAITIEIKMQTDAVIGQLVGLSEKDIEKVNKLYNCQLPDPMCDDRILEIENTICRMDESPAVNKARCVEHCRMLQYTGNKLQLTYADCRGVNCACRYCDKRRPDVVEWGPPMTLEYEQPGFCSGRSTRLGPVPFKQCRQIEGDEEDQMKECLRLCFIEIRLFHDGEIYLDKATCTTSGICECIISDPSRAWVKLQRAEPNRVCRFGKRGEPERA